MVKVFVVISNMVRRPSHYFSDTELHVRVRTISVHPSRSFVALVTHSSTGDVVSTNGTGVLCSRAWIRMYVARHLEEQVYVMVMMGISSSFANRHEAKHH